MEVALAVVNVTDVAVRCGAKLWVLSNLWRDAPDDIRSLRDEMKNTELFFDQIRRHIEITDTRTPSVEHEFLTESKDQPSELTNLIDDGHVVLSRIEAIVDSLVTSTTMEAQGLLVKDNKGEKPSKTKRMLWLRHSHKVARLRKELGHIRSSLCRFLISRNMFLSSEIHSLLEQSQREISMQLSSLSMSLESSQSTTLAQLEGRMQIMENRIPTTSKQTEMRPPQHTPQYKAEDARASDIVIPSRRGSLCGPSCTCRCHGVAKSFWNVDITLFRSIAGIVAVAYSRRGAQACLNPMCQDSQRRNRQPTWDVHAVYHLPDWLCRVSISAFFTNNLNGSPQMQLRMHNRRSAEDGWTANGLWRHIDQGNVEAVKAAFREGHATVYDLYGANHITPLWVAFERRNTAMIDLLLQAGADPFHKLDAFNTSIMSRAFQGANSGIPEYLALARLFPLTRYIEDLDLPPLHLAITGTTHIDLSNFLRTVKSPSLVDQKVPPEGFAPLHLASMRGDLSAVTLLLRYGANPNMRTDLGMTPLHFACKYGHDAVVSALLRNGNADARATDNFERHPMDCAAACVHKSTASIISLLLDHGAAIDGATTSDFTPLMYAIEVGTIGTVEYLLSRGADPSVRRGGEFDELAIWVALLTGEVDKMEALLKYGVDLTVVCSRDGRGVLHDLADHGRREMMELFLRREYLKGFRGVSTGAKDKGGKTPMVVFDEREGEEKEKEALRGVFERLLEGVEGVNLSREMEEVVVDEDVFFDADDGLGGPEG